VAATAVHVVRSTQRELHVESTPEGSRGGIVLTPWDRVQLVPRDFDVIVPPSHLDAQDWPRGMVIGRHAPSVDPGIQLWFGSPLANVMSVFLAPWRALAGQLDT
jgi:hypothetical protein